MKKLSVIIPIYNVEGTLLKCLNSIALSDDYEIILIDDGSTDSSGALCDNWANETRAKGFDVKVLHNKNGGLSCARNRGIDIADAAFITFVDSDDYIDSNVYSEVLQMFTPDVDIIEFGVKQEDTESTKKLAFHDIIYRSFADYWIAGEGYKHSYACNKIYRKTLFDDIRFAERKVFEDIIILPSLVDKAQSIRTCEVGFYHYVSNPNGISHNVNADGWKTMLDAHLSAHERIADELHRFSKKSLSHYYQSLLNVQLSENLATGDIPKPLNYQISPIYSTYKLKAIAYKILGIKGLCAAYRLFVKLRNLF